MGIRQQVRRSVVASTIVSIVIIGLIVLTAASFVSRYFVENFRQAIEQTMTENGIEPTQAQFFIEQVLENFGSWNHNGPMLHYSVLFGLGLLVIVGVSALFTAKLSRQFIPPLEKLRQAAEGISEGDLDCGIEFEADNEFGQVRDAFRDMQSHLKTSIEENLAQEQSRKELLAGISHDIRTPLTAVKGYVKGLLDGVAATPQKTEQYLNIIYGKAIEMERMVDQLFLFSRIDAGEGALHFAAVNADEFLRGYIETVRGDYQHKGLAITYDNNCAEPVALRVDIDEMARVFGNILENSAKYKPKEDGHLHITADKQAGYWVVEFADNGAGVPEEALGRLFDTFYRVDPARSGGIRGSGLGLAIAGRIVQAHDGEISARNQNGLVVAISLPVQEG